MEMPGFQCISMITRIFRMASSRPGEIFGLGLVAGTTTEVTAQRPGISNPLPAGRGDLRRGAEQLLTEANVRESTREYVYTLLLRLFAD